MAKEKSYVCVYCGKKFNPEVVPFQKVNLRYAHLDCFEGRGKIIEYMRKISNGESFDIKVGSQINAYLKQGYTLKGIYWTLVYVYEIQKRDYRLANGGIGIVPYKYAEAQQYFKNQSENKRLANDIRNNKTEVKMKTTSQVIYSKKNITKKKDKLLSLDYRKEE